MTRGPRDLVRPDVAAMRAYEEETPAGLNLQANTNLFGVNPALDRALATTRGHLLTEYPSMTSNAMRNAVAQRFGVDASMVVTGNGSNEVIDLLCRAFLSPGDRVAFHHPTFSMIPVFARVNHGAPVAVPLGPEWSLDAGALAAADAKLTFVVRPNNPTGNAFPRKDVERVVHEARGIVAVDEAYVEFLGGESFVKELRDGHERLVVLRTLSKAHGMAGLRVGYGVMPRWIAEETTKVRGPFRLDALAETAGVLALGDDRFVQQVVAGVRAERPNLKRMLEERGFQVFRSDANFLLARPPVPAQALAAALAQRGVHVRDFAGDLAPFVRITVGPPTVTARLRLALDDALPKLEGARA
ncbi:MAG TPA: aminotransferase class I/II-fold pyridoxal phosphate-dependent enzyme [Candidatus Thermoplasmatota archaeon]|nr:aminotransferase class I/II-fold pyridoxal phosphate-dependent enzyme [Candidatus Thermoplasmatota archaeon]